MDIVPRHPHLAGIRLRTRAMVIHENPFGTNLVSDVVGAGVKNKEKGKEKEGGGLNAGLMNGHV